jgi:hypothetical protein
MIHSSSSRPKSTEWTHVLGTTALLLVAQNASATSVPGSGVTGLLWDLLIILVGSTIAGIVAGILSGKAQTPVPYLYVPPALAILAVVILSSEYERNGNLGTLMLGFIPYLAAFFLSASLQRRQKR